MPENRFAGAGMRTVMITDAELEISFPVLLFYPTGDASQGTRIGPFPVAATLDAPIASGRFPLVLVSHGTGGINHGYRDLAVFLAKAGFIVALPRHHGNNREDDSLAFTPENMINRPRHLSLTIDALASDDILGPHVLSEKVIVAGHSMGGYTALAIAGGQPWDGGNPWQGAIRKIPVKHDTRVAGLVLLAPATIWFSPDDSLQHVHTPVLLLTASDDTGLMPGWHGYASRIVLDRLPAETEVIFRTVEGAGHFAFMTPYPEHMRSPAIPPSMDPPGFDRPAFLAEMNREILAFIERVLGA